MMSTREKLETIIDVLPDILAGYTPRDTSVSRRKIPTSRPPMNLTLIDWWRGIEALYTQACIYWENTHTEPPEDACEALAHVAGSDTLEADCGALIDEIYALTRHLWPLDVQVWLCPRCHFPLHYRDGYVTCEAGHEYPGLDAWRHHPSVTLEEASHMFNIPISTLTSWHQRRRLPYDSSKSRKPGWVFPWDIIRLLHPGLVAEL